MPYIKRDAQGAIVAFSQEKNDGFDESIELDSDELSCFLAQWQTEQNGLSETDKGFIRVLEDVIDVLINKNIIRFTDLPEAARQKMQQRQRLREDLSPRLDLLFDEIGDDGF